ncbi:hypothetical protein [Bacillus alkalicellulosilyticus]|uniref:hypothetical protein n=1 Tax=Alkalihalobacterium alkalicellulosilyticum TaxID=1912214 RepID=UPI000997F571|nr:hypothetical protein [Bacillus alkalicellulosilyticus]
MLEFSFLATLKYEEIIFDNYIPLSVRWDSNSRIENSNLFFRTGDLESTLLEIGIEPSKGIINSITLTLVNDIEIIDHNFFENIPGKTGLPAFNILNWGESRYRDELMNFKLLFSQENLYIIFSGNLKVSNKIVSERVSFGFNEENILSFISIENLTKLEIEKLKESIFI